MKRGKKICNTLKEVRMQVAKANDIKYAPTECHHEGDCAGTCPKCEAEVRWLEQQLQLRRQLGKAVAVVGVSMGLVALTACDIKVTNQTANEVDITPDTLTEVSTTADPNATTPNTVPDPCATDPNTVSDSLSRSIDMLQTAGCVVAIPDSLSTASQDDVPEFMDSVVEEVQPSP